MAITCSISWNISIHMEWGETIWAMISTCLCCQWNFFFAVYTCKWFVYLFHNQFRINILNQEAVKTTYTSPKHKVGSSSQYVIRNTGSQENSEIVYIFVIPTHHLVYIDYILSCLFFNINWKNRDFSQFFHYILFYRH